MEQSDSDSDRMRALETPAPGVESSAALHANESLPDDSFGRYRVTQLLGSGGFACVWLAHDPTLDRSVAIKVPRAELKLRPAIRARFIEEGRSLARLTHPAVVSVYDVGVSENGLPFVVMEYVSGQSLSSKLKAQPVGLAESLNVLIQVGEGLRAMHQAQVVHRDLKPGNLVIDARGKARIIDFGLALTDGISLRQLGAGQEGTPAYMAPEQVRGLNHQIDGRTDIWSFGVIMYQLLTERLPFGGRRAADFGYRICSVHPIPPRQINGAVPAELERICLKCMAKSMSERYATVGDLIRELQDARDRLGDSLAGDKPVVAHASKGSDSLSQPRSEPMTPQHPSTVTNLVTHGLRAFRQRDAEFFFELLPGLRDARGVPETIAFWEDQLGHTLNQPGLPLGIIYGPSGCGKTSFVCAGLIPRLAGEFQVIYLECDPRTTESRLARQLDQRYPSLEPIDLLEEKLHRLRLDVELLNLKRVLVVLDQFERWLRPPRQFHREALVEALRQFDGDFLSCVILIRDDYWMGLTELTRSLDMHIQEGINALAYPLFDRRHAEYVLTRFGQTMNCLPADQAALTKSQQKFITTAVKSFARNGKVVCVHLAIFAQMMRDRPWDVAELRRVGGWKGVGIRFLEETFSNPESPRAMRRYLPEISSILERLVAVGKGDFVTKLVSETELKQAAQLVERPDDFEQIVDILLISTRLMTQVDAGNEAEPGDERWYQLSHDFLAGPIHEWLARQRLASWRGRAHLRLVELSNQWSVAEDSRFLPTGAEWLAMTMGVPQRVRDQHARFIQAATRRIVARFSAVALVVIAVASVAIGLVNQSWRRIGEGSADTLIAARPSQLSASLEAVGNAYSWARPRLDALAADPALQHPWRIYLARLDNRDRVPESLESLAAVVDQIPDDEIPIVIETLQPFRNIAAAPLEARFAETTTPLSQARLAIMLLFLQKPEAARQVLAADADPTQRTLFIRHFGACAGDLSTIASFLPAEDAADFESGLVLAVSRMPRLRLPTADVAQWMEIFRKLFVESPAAGTHSAAQWAIGHWGGELPAVEAQPNPPIDKDWWVIEPVPGHQLTMVRIPAGQVVAGESLPEWFREHRNITVRPEQPERLNSFWMSATEVDCGLFKEFLAAQPPGSPPICMSRKIDIDQPINRDRPILGLQMATMAEFCNWLSRRLKRDESFAIDDRSVEVIAAADGFKLPLRLEWEYACLCNATTLFPIGGMDQIDALADYSWYMSPELEGSSPVKPCGTKMPNAWGVFDMLGNANEWCADGPPNDKNQPRYLLGGHNSSMLEHLYAGFPEYDIFALGDFQGVRLTVRDE